MRVLYRFLYGLLIKLHLEGYKSVLGLVLKGFGVEGAGLWCLRALVVRLAFEGLVGAHEGLFQRLLGF